MSIKKVLVVRFSSLGDIVLLTPLFREIKRKYPTTQLDFITSTTFREICSNNPHIDRIIAFDRKKGKNELFRVAKAIRLNKYDLVFDVHRSLRSRLLLILGFRFHPFKRKILKIDKRSWKRNLLLHTKINLLKKRVAQREAYCQLLGDNTAADSFVANTELFPGDYEKKRVKSILQQFKLEGKPIIALGPGSSFQGKTWPKERYLDLSNTLQKMGFSLAILGGADDIEPKWIVENSIKKPLNLAGKLSFLESAEFLKFCKITISNDSAVVHFSEAVGTPAIAIFGPTTTEFGYAPYLENSKVIEMLLPCRPCSRNGKGKCKNMKNERECLTGISVDMVLKEIQSVLK